MHAYLGAEKRTHTDDEQVICIGVEPAVKQGAISMLCKQLGAVPHRHGIATVPYPTPDTRMALTWNHEKRAVLSSWRTRVFVESSTALDMVPERSATHTDHFTCLEMPPGSLNNLRLRYAQRPASQKGKQVHAPPRASVKGQHLPVPRAWITIQTPAD